MSEKIKCGVAIIVILFGFGGCIFVGLENIKNHKVRDVSNKHESLKPLCTLILLDNVVTDEEMKELELEIKKLSRKK